MELENSTVRDIALKNGFKLKTQPDGIEDLNPYVYDFAKALIKTVTPKKVSLTIPVEVLHAASYMAAGPKDYRDHLKGVAVGDGSIAATNGHVLFYCDVADLNGVKQFIIPVATINSLMRKLPASQKKGYVKIEVDYTNESGLITANYGTTFEYFKFVSGEFPAWRNLLKQIGEKQPAEKIPHVNWQYVMLFEKASIALSGGTRSYNRMHNFVRLNYYGPNTALEVVFPHYDYKDSAHGLLMPIRDY